MNKLAIAAFAVAGLCGAVSADVTSANVVGYQNVMPVSGFSFIAPTFEKVDGSALTLGDIIPTGDDAGYGTEHITIFDSDLFVDKEFTYYCEDAGMEFGAGWYDESDGSFANAIELAGIGRGVQIEAQNVVVQFSGQVKAGKISMANLASGFLHICNPTPVTQGIQNFVVSGGDSGYGTEHITIFDPDLFVDKEFTWYCEDAGMEFGAGWYDESDGSYADYDVLSGSGFLFESGGDVTIELPAVL